MHVQVCRRMAVSSRGHPDAGAGVQDAALKADGVAHIRIEYRDELHNIPKDEYIKIVEQYDSLTELSAEILKEAAVYGGVDTGALQEMAADIEHGNHGRRA